MNEVRRGGAASVERPGKPRLSCRRRPVYLFTHTHFPLPALTKKILIAHSNPKAKRTLTLLLADAGFDVRATTKAAEAVELAKHELFDLAMVEQALRVADADMLGAIRGEQPTLPVFPLSLIHI